MLLGVDNAVLGMLYGWTVCMPLNERAGVPFFFFLLKYGFLGLTPLSSGATALIKSYLKVGLQIVR